MRRLTCRSVRDLLPLHCGGDLPPEKAIAVDQHLHACLACFREYRDFAAMRGRLLSGWRESVGRLLRRV